MFEQVTSQRSFLGVNHLKKSRRYFEKKIYKIKKKSWKKSGSRGIETRQNTLKKSLKKSWIIESHQRE